MGFFTKKIFDAKKSVFGIDLSDLSVKIVQLKKRGSEHSIEAYALVPIPVGCIADGEILKRDVVISAIKKVIASAQPHKIKTKKVVCSLPETKAFLRIINMPEMKEDELKEAIKWEMEANIPLPLDQVYYDWQMLENGFESEKGENSILVVAVSKNIIDNVQSLLQEAGLELVGLDIESIAQARSLIKEDGKNRETMLVIDIGDRRTSFLVSKEGIPCFTSSIPFCGQFLTEAIARGMNVSFEEAEKIKLENGIGSDYKNDSIFSFVSPALESFIQDIERNIDFYLSGLRYSEGIDRVVICGGGANTKGITPYISRRIGREIEIADPWTNLNIKKKLPIIDKKSSLQFATAIGLALKGLYYEDFY